MEWFTVDTVPLVVGRRASTALVFTKYAKQDGGGDYMVNVEAVCGSVHGFSANESCHVDEDGRPPSYYVLEHVKNRGLVSQALQDLKTHLAEDRPSM